MSMPLVKGVLFREEIERKKNPLPTLKHDRGHSNLHSTAAKGCRCPLEHEQRKISNLLILVRMVVVGFQVKECSNCRWRLLWTQVLQIWDFGNCCSWNWYHQTMVYWHSHTVSYSGWDNRNAEWSTQAWIYVPPTVPRRQNQSGWQPSLGIKISGSGWEPTWQVPSQGHQS